MRTDATEGPVGSVPQGSDAGVLLLASRLAAKFRLTAAERDAAGTVPLAEAREMARQGLFALFVPDRYGGRPFKPSVIIEAARIIATGDPSLAQLLQNHYVPQEHLRTQAFGERTRTHLFQRVLAGEHFAATYADKHTDRPTAIIQARTGQWTVTGEKYFSTGAFAADWLFVSGRDGTGRKLRAIAASAADGVRRSDDWTAIGQRGTHSGTTCYDAVPVDADRVAPQATDDPPIFLPLTQGLHAAVEVGIARAALEEVTGIARSTHASKHAHADRAADDPYVAEALGACVGRVNAAEALLRRAGEFADRAWARLDDDIAFHDATIASFEAKSFGAQVALDVSAQIFSLVGARAAFQAAGLDRHWRNARAHSLHAPVKWVNRYIGEWVLNGQPPPMSTQ